MRLLASRFVIALAIGGLLTAPAEASRIFRAGQQQFLKGIDPSVATTGTCTYPGTPAAIFKASDTANLYTDTAGTTNVAADGDPVGRWVDSNGSGFYVQSAADDTTRPTWHAAAGGRPAYISFDGSNDILRRTSATLGIFAAGAGTAVAAIRHNASAQGNFYGEGNSADADTLYMLLRNLSADFNDMSALVRSDGLVVLFAGTTLVVDEAYPTTTDAVVAVTDDGANIQGWFDGASSSAVAYALSRGGNALTIDTSAIGGLYRSGGPTGLVSGDLYELALWGSKLSAPNMATATTCAGLAQNRTL